MAILMGHDGDSSIQCGGDVGSQKISLGYWWKYGVFTGF